MRKILIGLLVIFYFVPLLYAQDDIDKLKRRVRIITWQIKGWCSEEKAMHFLDLVLQVKPKVCVEIGVFGGASLLPVACGLKHLGQGRVIGIDAWENVECIKYLDVIEDKEHIDWWSKLNLSDIHYSLLEKLLVYELENYCTILKKPSELAVTEIESIDILHIDGHRSEEQSTHDVSLYLPKVSSGGYIWIGDALSYNKQKGIDLLLEQCDTVHIIDSGNCILFRKR